MAPISFPSWLNVVLATMHDHEILSSLDFKKDPVLQYIDQLYPPYNPDDFVLASRGTVHVPQKDTTYYADEMVSGNKFHFRTNASGYRFNTYEPVAARSTSLKRVIPMGAFIRPIARVTRNKAGKIKSAISTIVKATDVKGARGLDLSKSDYSKIKPGADGVDIELLRPKHCPMLGRTKSHKRKIQNPIAQCLPAEVNLIIGRSPFFPKKRVNSNLRNYPGFGSFTMRGLKAAFLMHDMYEWIERPMTYVEYVGKKTVRTSYESGAPGVGWRFVHAIGPFKSPQDACTFAANIFSLCDDYGCDDNPTSAGEVMPFIEGLKKTMEIQIKPWSRKAWDMRTYKRLPKATTFCAQLEQRIAQKE